MGNTAARNHRSARCEAAIECARSPISVGDPVTASCDSYIVFTADILREYQGNIAKLASETDAGNRDAMNQSILSTTGDIVGILNSDDFFESPDTIQYVVNGFCSSSYVDIVFGDVVFVESSDLATVKRFYSSRRFKPWKLRFGWMPPHPGTFVRRGAYTKCGQYSLKYKISSDYEMFVRWLIVENLPYLRIDHVLVRMRQGGVSTAGLKSNFLLNMRNS